MNVEIILRPLFVSIVSHFQSQETIHEIHEPTPNFLFVVFRVSSWIVGPCTISLPVYVFVVAEAALSTQVTRFRNGTQLDKENNDSSS